jgi:prephenate dehydrogenase
MVGCAWSAAKAASKRSLVVTGSKKTVGIVGLGLMGASLARAFRDTGDFQSVVGYDEDPAAVRRARDEECVDDVLDTAADVARNADLLVLCTPVQQIIVYLEELGQEIRPGTIVMDIGSTKVAVTEAMAKVLPDGVIPIGGHPMTGPATAGVQGPSGEMYKDRVFVLTPTDKTSSETVAWCTEALTRIGARVEVLEAERHDRLVSIVSHLPRMIPVPLLSLAIDDPDPMVTTLPAGGFRESTRKATGNLDMWVDVLVTNNTHIVETMRRFAREVDAVADKISEADPAALREILTDADNRWHGLFGSEGVS